MSVSNRDLTAAERWIGGALMLASIALTVHSLFRMCVMRTSASKLFLFPIVNTLLLACELDTTLYIGLNALKTNLNTKWMQAGKDVSLALVTTIILYLAYMRCRAVFLPYRRYPWAHYTLLVTCPVVLLAAFAADVAAITGCDGDVDDPRCSAVRVIGRVKEWSVPVMRFYYIISEGIFFVLLYRTLWKREDGENPGALDRLLRFTTIMFTFDLMLLTAVSVYRIIRLFRPLPDHELVELFSIAITVFNMTEFGLSIPKLFRPVQHADISPRTTAHQSVVMAPSSPRNDDGDGSIREASDRCATMPMHSKSYSSSHAPLASCLSIHASNSHRYSRSSDYEGNRLTQFDVHMQAFDHSARNETHVHQADKLTGAANLSNPSSSHDSAIDGSNHNLPLSDDNICGLGEDIRPSSGVYGQEG